MSQLEALRTRMRTPWCALFAVCFAQAVVLLDTTAVNVAVPAITTGLDTGLTQVLWVINAYLLSFAVLLVTGGRLGDLFGSRRVFLIGLLVFTLASAACGLAQDPGQAIAARVLQGIGGALLTPQTLVIINQIFPADRRGAALGVWGSFAGIVAAAGPTVGGLLVASLGWRWIFYINIPIGIVGGALVLLSVPRLPSRSRPRIDIAGSALLSVAMLFVVYGLLEGESRNWGEVWGPVTVPVLIAAGLLVLGLFFLLERGRQHRDPLVPFAVLRNRDFTLMSAVVCVLPCGLGGMLLLTGLYLQDVQGLSAFRAGLVIAVAPLVSVFIAPYSGRLTDRFGGKYVMITGLLAFSGGIALIAALIRAESGPEATVPGLLLVGVGMGVAFAPASVVAFKDIDPEMAGAASGLFNTTRLCGSLLGSAAVGALLQAQLARTDMTTAIRVTYLLPVAIMLVGAAATLAVRGQPTAPPKDATGPLPGREPQSEAAGG
ncbi:MFS transporter [Streptomyces sp. XD-27]|uniref:MFS transporter n=1 Tax=Streptomyces sp. XD-27 TaxID=3062779 RepID=UPI0026F42F1F|nr:MFS transporter [Streptomyces sp. XD-27]WKX69273.1 MFS transporter [Streptomyces sp. XD-27]